MKEKLLEILANQTFIDSHEHLDPESMSAGKDFFLEYTDSYIGQDLISAGMSQEDYKKLSDTTIPLNTRYKLFEPYFEKVKFTGYGICFRKAISRILDGKELSLETIDEAQKNFLARRSKQSVVEFLSRECNIEKVLADYMGYEWEYGDEIFVQSYNFGLMLTVDGLWRFDRMKWFTSITVTDFDSYVKACVKIIENKHKQQNVKVLKLAAAYFRTLDFPETSYEEAKNEFDLAYAYLQNDVTVPKGNFANYYKIQNYVVHKVLQYANQNNMTLQVHTGYLAGNSGDIRHCDPYHLIPLIEKYSEVSFDIFHMAYPDYLKAGVLAKSFPNVYVNMCWTHVLSPNAAINGLNEWLDTVPYNKIIGFGGDYHFPDMVYSHRQMAQENVANVFLSKINAGYMTLDGAQEIAKKIFYENPKRLYHLN